MSQNEPKRGTNSTEFVYLQDPGVVEKYSFHENDELATPTYPETRNS